jgi:hypothetical protein
MLYIWFPDYAGIPRYPSYCLALLRASDNNQYLCNFLQQDDLHKPYFVFGDFHKVSTVGFVGRVLVGTYSLM